MSLKSELQELVDWISGLEAESDPASQPVPIHNWDRVDDNLESARKQFEKAAAALRTRDSEFVDFARDLERETEGAKLRAKLLARRAPKEQEKKPVHPLAAPFAALLAKCQTHKTEEHQKVKKGPDESPTKNGKTPKKPSVLVRFASRSLETAHANVLKGIAHPDAVAHAFANELDLLSEMALSLRLQLEAEEHEAPTPAKRAARLTFWEWLKQTAFWEYGSAKRRPRPIRWMLPKSSPKSSRKAEEPKPEEPGADGQAPSAEDQRDEPSPSH